jgi:hypothetical protein
MSAHAEILHIAQGITGRTHVETEGTEGMYTEDVPHRLDHLAYPLITSKTNADTQTTSKTNTDTHTRHHNTLNETQT